MLIESIEIENYRVFRDTKFENLSPLTVVIGANGSGKSTLFDLMTFLQESLSQNVAQAITRRGGFKELVSRGETGPISIVLKLRDTGGHRVAYSLKITANGTPPIVHCEVLSLLRNDTEGPAQLMDFTLGIGTAIPTISPYDGAANGANSVPFNLENQSVLALSVVGQLKEHGITAEVLKAIENWHVSDFHISDARTSAEAGYAEHLSKRGDNVAQVAQYLYENHRERFELVMAKMSERVPGVHQVEAKPTEDGRLVLRFQDGSFKDPFISRYVSDGTIKMFAYLVLLYDPKPHPLLAIEEPENQLYPELLHELLEEFRDYANRGGQVFVSTHSPDFLNGAKLEEIFWLVKEDGFTTVRRASESELLQNLVGEGDLPGGLWKQGLFEGVGLR